MSCRNAVQRGPFVAPRNDNDEFVFEPSLDSDLSRQRRPFDQSQAEATRRDAFDNSLRVLACNPEVDRWKRRAKLLSEEAIRIAQW